VRYAESANVKARQRVDDAVLRGLMFIFGWGVVMMALLVVDRGGSVIEGLKRSILGSFASLTAVPFTQPRAK